MILCSKYKKRDIKSAKRKIIEEKRKKRQLLISHIESLWGKKDRRISNNCTENNDTWPPYNHTETLVSYLMNDGIIGLIQWR